MAPSKELVAFDDRIASFRAHRVGNGSKRGAVKAWPHTRPSVTQMAKAGFIYNPSPKSPDNVTCFLCDKSLDGWNKGDDPKLEHLDHSPRCAWAIIHRSDWKEDEYHDPECSEMLNARLETFGTWWPHDGKRGWIPTSNNMSKAGFFYNPGRPGDDFAACMYCGVVLDGWEPKDDPIEEHRRRGPDCYFFTRLHGGSSSSKSKRTSKARQSTTAVSKRSSARKRLSSEVVTGDEVEVEESKPKRRANKRNSKVRRSSIAEDISREVDEANASQTPQRRLSARLVASREITLSSLPTDSIAEGEEEPEIPLKRTRGPRPMKPKTKTKQLLHTSSPNAQTVPPLPPLPVIMVDQVLGKSSPTRATDHSRVSSGSSSSLLEDLIANYSENYEEALESAITNVNPNDTSVADLRVSTPATEIKIDQAVRSSSKPTPRAATPKINSPVMRATLMNGQKKASMNGATEELISDTSQSAAKASLIKQSDSPSPGSSTATLHVPARVTRSHNKDTENSTVSQTRARMVSRSPAFSDGLQFPTEVHSNRRDAAARTPREETAFGLINLNSSPRVLTDSPQNGNVAPISRENPSYKRQWSPKSLSCYVEELDDPKQWVRVLGEAENISEMDMGMTVEAWIMHVAEMGERALMMRCDRLIEFLESESVRAIKQLQSLSS
ncbi:hypothetical protein POJ06DRAFT_95752 [Lipomyces tetrasporus]|uniref:BIR-domain-containing protein n=1 Tax=Lipomyces tetrasporus TaxID=54092 RepID=A0AAD7VTV2_9ASCO|nr:uncharacterized protein POJ06DRAFT_95752 [Lipomyces tetrasporus]KAJ8101381.1 hypothetical protein POJ06DRAFT_95752 [Lipomyces tetrasporus]